jgi:hypothetical protein
MSHADIVAKILANPLACQVNRTEKMSATVNVMVSNRQKQIDEAQLYAEQSTGDIQLTGADYGYGTGRKQND